jgi:hypothetical protein
MGLSVKNCVFAAAPFMLVLGVGRQVGSIVIDPAL